MEGVGKKEEGGGRGRRKEEEVGERIEGRREEGVKKGEETI